MADDRVNFPSRFPDPNHFDYEIDPRTGDIEDPKATQYRRDREAQFGSGPPEETPASEPEPSELADFDSGPEGTPTPEDAVGYQLRRKDVEFAGVLEAMQLHALLPGNEWEREQLETNPRYFNAVYDRMKQAGGGRFKPIQPGTYRGGQLVSESPSESESDPKPPARADKMVAKLKDQIRTGATPRARKEAEEKLISYYMRGGR